MHPSLTALLRRPGLRRPAVLASASTLALAVVLAGGLAVARAVDGSPDAEPVATTASESPAADTGTAGLGTTTSGGDDNVAVANNTRDGSTVYAIRLKVSFTGADIVDSGNAAVAVASCTDCQTVAIALEGVIVTGDAEVVAPENIALAINVDCSNCQTLAYAYQNLQTVDGKARMTGQGRKKIAELRRQLNALRTSGLDIFAVRAEVNRIAGEFAEVLENEIVPIGKAAASPGSSARPSTSSSPSASPSADAGATTSGAGAGTEPSASPSSAVSPSPSASPSASPSPTG